jgi:hypothetical protein
VLIVIILLFLLALGALPVFPYSGEWGYGPTGFLWLLLLLAVAYYFVYRAPREPLP